MAPPALRIPVSANLDQLQQDMQKGISITRQAVGTIVKQFVSANRDILTSSTSTTALLSAQWTSLSASGVASALALKLAFVAAFAAALAGGRALIDSVRDQLQNVLELADKAQKAGVDPAFFQAFLAGARAGRVAVKDLEDALSHATEQMKREIADWNVWDDVTNKLDKTEQKLRGLRELFSTEQKFTALDLFRDAADPEGRIRAVLTGMQELNAIGERIASIDLAKSFFGDKFAADIEAGKNSAEQMLVTLDRMKDGGGGIWSGQLVADTKEVDRQLASAHDRLRQDLQPQFEQLVGIANDLKSAWTGVVNVLDQAVQILNRIDPAWVGRLVQLGVNPGAALGNFVSDQFRTPPVPGQLANELGLNDIGRGPGPLARQAGAADLNVPLPRRRPSDAPAAEKEKKDAQETTDAFDAATAAVGRHIASLTADAAATGLTQAAHEQLRVELRLIEAARQSGVEITEKQIAQYAELRATMSAEQALAASGIKLTDDQALEFMRLSEAILSTAQNLERKRNAFQGTVDAVRFAGNELVDVIDRATQRGAKFGDIMSDVLRNVSKQLLQAAITGEGAFAKMLGLNSPVSGGIGGLGGLVASLFKGGGAGAAVPTVGIAGDIAVPTFAEGGTVPPNTDFIFAEHSQGGPRFGRTGSQPMVITPNNVVSAGGGDNIAVHLSFGDIDARGATPGAGAEIVAALERRIPALAVAAVRDATRRRAL